MYRNYIVYFIPSSNSTNIDLCPSLKSEVMWTGSADSPEDAVQRAYSSKIDAVPERRCKDYKALVYTREYVFEVERPKVAVRLLKSVGSEALSDPTCACSVCGRDCNMCQDCLRYTCRCDCY